MNYVRPYPAGSTPTGLPYPASSAPVSAGADNIRALADGVDGRPKGFLAMVRIAPFDFQGSASLATLSIALSSRRRLRITGHIEATAINGNLGTLNVSVVPVGGTPARMIAGTLASGAAVYLTGVAYVEAGPTAAFTARIDFSATASPPGALRIAAGNGGFLMIEDIGVMPVGGAADPPPPAADPDGDSVGEYFDAAEVPA